MASKLPLNTLANETDLWYGVYLRKFYIYRFSAWFINMESLHFYKSKFQ